MADFFTGFLAFLAYFGAGLVAFAVYIAVYTRITAHDELILIKDGNQAAAIAFSGSLLGFAIAITSLIRSSVGLGDFFAWAVIALAVQLLAYWTVKAIFPHISERISNAETPAAIWLAAVSISAGLLNAASMSY
jgi:putative membrane protein